MLQQSVLPGVGPHRTVAALVECFWDGAVVQQPREVYSLPACGLCLPCALRCSRRERCALQSCPVPTSLGWCCALGLHPQHSAQQILLHITGSTTEYADAVTLQALLLLFSQNSTFSPSPALSSCPPRLCPLSFGEGVEFDPLPPKEIR